MKVVVRVVISVVVAQQFELASASSGFASPLSRWRGSFCRGGRFSWRSFLRRWRRLVGWSTVKRRRGITHSCGCGAFASATATSHIGRRINVGRRRVQAAGDGNHYGIHEHFRRSGIKIVAGKKKWKDFKLKTLCPVYGIYGPMLKCIRFLFKYLICKFQNCLCTISMNANFSFIPGRMLSELRAKISR